MNLLIEKARIRDRVFVVIVRLITALARSGECGDSDMVGKIFHMYYIYTIRVLTTLISTPYSK